MRATWRAAIWGLVFAPSGWSPLGFGPVPALAAACQPAAAPGVEGAAARVCVLAPDGEAAWRVFVASPEAPRAVLVMFTGGTGRLGLSTDGRFRHGANVLVRTRGDWLARGFAVVIPDAPGLGSLRGRRSGAGFAREAGALLAFVRGQFTVPLFVFGTSQGAIAAVNASAGPPPGEIAGLILTESVSRRGGSGETVFDARPDMVRAPVLVVANAADACPVTPPADAARIAAAFTQAPSADVLRVSGGRTGERTCGSLSAHGYHGIEPTMVDGIAGWINARLPAAPR